MGASLHVIKLEGIRFTVNLSVVNEMIMLLNLRIDRNPELNDENKSRKVIKCRIHINCRWKTTCDIISAILLWIWYCPCYMSTKIFHFVFWALLHLITVRPWDVALHHKNLLLRHFWHRMVSFLSMKVVKLHLQIFPVLLLKQQKSFVPLTNSALFWHFWWAVRQFKTNHC